ncbi:triphosphoribosyl-dephospho-CoA synthase MdcB [Beijerinckia sp. L45]|uniref:triphosphoribosyl-dephospho-CoA synthase MdcB n=1 Tax=Beijerinckia sp. L45 TaxID=1641855 RepID=UPI00131CF1EF|nr:triphosphoribosyl-dephospho-CoA synthase MdcB [Beijerinckia sp. L45]
MSDVILRPSPLGRSGRLGVDGASLSHDAVGALASECLTLEVDTWPKPGLVSHIDNGSHRDMDAALLRRSAATLKPFFSRVVEAGAEGATMDRLRMIGIEAEAAMLAATRDVNTHRGAIFGLGLLCAATGLRGAGLAKPDDRLGDIVRRQWAQDIANGPVVLHSHGTRAARLHGASGARGEACAGFPGVYDIGLPALKAGAKLAPYDAEAIRVHAIFALIAGIKDTNLLHRGGAEGLAFARASAAEFMRHGGIARHGWRLDAAFIHAEFVKRRLSPGGAADLLAMSLFVHALEP